MATEAQAKQLVDLIIYLSKNSSIDTKPTYEEVISTMQVLLTNLTTTASNPKEYSVFVTQQGTSAPTVLIKKNSIGDVVWSRVSIGTYDVTKIGAFVENSTVPSNIPVVFKNKLNNSEVTVKRISSDVIEVSTKDVDGKLTDGLLTNFYIEFNVFV